MLLTNTGKGLLVIWSVAERQSGAGQDRLPSDEAPRWWVRRGPQPGHPWMGSPQMSPCWEPPGSKEHQIPQSPGEEKGEDEDGKHLDEGLPDWLTVAE